MKNLIILLAIVQASITALAQTSSTNDGLWNTAANWTNGVPNSTEIVTVTNDMTLDTDMQIDNGGEYYISGRVIDPTGGTSYQILLQGSGILDISGTVKIEGNFTVQNNSKFYLRSNDTLIVGGNATFQNNSELTIETGAVFIIKGNLNLENNNATVLNGNMYVEGDVAAKNKAIIDGTGNFQSEGEVDIQNQSALFGSDTPCISNCEYGSGTGLPIELKNFEATLHPFNKKVVELKWTTLSEINNQYFVIEHSTDGKHFEEVNKVEGAGNSNRELNYSLLVNIENITAQHYFRLKQIDYDGSSKAFNAVALQQSNDNSFEANHSVEVYPSPTNGEKLKLSLQNFEAGVYDLVLMSSNGQMVVNNSINLQDGASERSIDLLNGLQLNKGIYFVRMIYKKELITKKIIVN